MPSTSAPEFYQAEGLAEQQHYCPSENLLASKQKQTFLWEISPNSRNSGKYICLSISNWHNTMRFNVCVNVINYRLQVQIFVFLPQSWRQENFQEWPGPGRLTSSQHFPGSLGRRWQFHFCFSEIYRGSEIRFPVLRHDVTRPELDLGNQKQAGRETEEDELSNFCRGV